MQRQSILMLVPSSEKSRRKFHLQIRATKHLQTHQHGKCFKMISLARLLKAQERSLFLSRFFVFGEGARMSVSLCGRGIFISEDIKRWKRNSKIPRTWWNAYRLLQCVSQRLIIYPSNSFLCDVVEKKYDSTRLEGNARRSQNLHDYS